MQPSSGKKKKKKVRRSSSSRKPYSDPPTNSKLSLFLSAAFLLLCRASWNQIWQREQNTSSQKTLGLLRVSIHLSPSASSEKLPVYHLPWKKVLPLSGLSNVSGLKAWASGDLEGFGKLMSASALSSIHYYECGNSPHLWIILILTLILKRVLKKIVFFFNLWESAHFLQVASRWRISARSWWGLREFMGRGSAAPASGAAAWASSPPPTPRKRRRSWSGSTGGSSPRWPASSNPALPSSSAKQVTVPAWSELVSIFFSPGRGHFLLDFNPPFIAFHVWSFPYDED